ncbi:tRNA preQ1(34) S-adenosylmethionine ribosyltransferase-isomerase QueA [Candidatus Sumerlaeota bacterium]|nr:tRNA preQ1(34) S-adenosylmethionine ribosyltransferase-isomerase QueA [Candidatus Sumerlaeota bacterium]
MKTRDFDYALPEASIARRPASHREDSRLMVLDRASGSRDHRRFAELPEILREGDLLTMNDTRVLPARLLGRRAPDGGKIEALLLRREDERRWWALVRPGKKIQVGDRLIFAPQRLEARVAAYGERGGGERLLEFRYSGDWWTILSDIAHTPLPPYILRARKRDAEAAGHGSDAFVPEEPEDRERYQTVFAHGEPASVAAPTAGLHFSESVLKALESRGIERCFVQLDVGAATFQPIKTETVEEHPMHEERFRIPEETAALVNRAKAEGRRVVAVGTTVVRALETAALVGAGEAEGIFRAESQSGCEVGAIFPESLDGWTRLMIAPGFRFRATDVLLTNFHLPRSSLILLVSALTGREELLDAYREAIEKKYRFYSYGDCMLIR